MRGVLSYFGPFILSTLVILSSPFFLSILVIVCRVVLAEICISVKFVPYCVVLHFFILTPPL